MISGQLKVSDTPLQFMSEDDWVDLSTIEANQGILFNGRRFGVTCSLRLIDDTWLVDQLHINPITEGARRSQSAINTIGDMIVAAWSTFIADGTTRENLERENLQAAITNTQAVIDSLRSSLAIELKTLRMYENALQEYPTTRPPKPEPPDILILKEGQVPPARNK